MTHILSFINSHLANEICNVNDQVREQQAYESDSASTSKTLTRRGTGFITYTGLIWQVLRLEFQQTLMSPTDPFLLDEGHDLSAILLQIGAHAFIMSTDSGETLLQAIMALASIMRFSTS